MKESLNILWSNLNHFIGKIGNDVIKIRLQKSIPFWIASLIVGLVAVIYSTIFSWAESLLKFIFSLEPLLIFIMAPIFMLAGWWLVQRYAPNAGGSGVPQVMAAIDLVTHNPRSRIRSLLGIKVAFIKIISSTLMVLGGAAIGKEGPIIQISSSIFNFFYRFIPKDWHRYKRSSLIVAGAAAGLAAAFNTPLGGIVFAIEELSKVHVRFYRTALFIAVIISGLTAEGFLGPYLYLGYPSVGDTSWFMFAFVITVAIVGGLLGSVLGKLIYKLIVWRKKMFSLTIHKYSYVVIIALIIASFAYFISFSVTGSGKDLMQQLLFSDNFEIKWYDFPLRFIGSLLSFSLGAAGGIFAPALSAGAALGGFLGNLFNFQQSDNHLIILAGMVAFLTSITRTPFTSAILVLEMTDRSSVVFYLLVAGIVANFASKLIDRKSLYEHLKVDYLHDFMKKSKNVVKNDSNNINSELVSESKTAPDLGAETSSA